MILIAAASPNPLPMDVWYSAVDDNNLPLNPTWEYSRQGRGLPNAGLLCNHFPNRNGILYIQNCTDQEPIVDEPRPFNGLIPNVRHLVCSYRREPGDQLRADSVHGHVNWGIVTYTGTMSFADFGFPPFADGDWDWTLQTENKNGYLASNDPNGIVAEFNGAELSQRWTAGWWMGLNERVMASQHHRAQARAAAHDLPAIVTGILGIDTKHVEHAEIHPIYALALRTSVDKQYETWAFFVRNWGNEGGCSNDQHNFNVATLSFAFPMHSGHVPTEAGIVARSSADGLRFGEAMHDGLILTLELAPPSAHSVDSGEITLCYAEPCGFVDHVQFSDGRTNPMKQDNSIAVVRHRNLAADEPRPLNRDTNH